MTDTHQVLHGIGVCAGTAHGPLAFVVAAPGVDEAEGPCSDPAADGERVRQAMALVSESLKKRAEGTEDQKSKAVLQATAQLASDKGLAKAVDKKLKKGEGITHAVYSAVEDYSALLKKLGGYMAERVTDLRDVRDRTIAQLRGLPAPGVPQIETPSIVVARDLAPAETATLNRDKVLGIVTEEGGPTSHTAILAAQLGIPCAVKVSGLLENLSPEDTVVLDGGVGEVIVSPTEAEVDQLAERSRRRALALAGSSGQGATRDGHHVALYANIGNVDDAKRAASFDLEGCGLFRTEFLFLGRTEAPSLEEQTNIYTKVLEAFGGRHVVVRTLDAGADKPLAFANQEKEENPALGVRGLRLSMRREDLIDTQLQALAAAYEKTHAELWVMAPMVSTVDETEWFVKKAKAYGLPTVGVMVEVPAAAIRSNQVLSECDFCSLGTNDLAQYTMASDRLNGELANLLTPWQPAVLRMIKFACEGGAATGKPVGVCGEAGGDPLMALVLAGLGVNSLSMAATKVNAVRAALRLHDLSTCQQMAAYALDARTAEDARAAVIALADPQLLDLL